MMFLPSINWIYPQVALSGKSKSTAGILAIFLGGFGIHRFYLGQWWGIFYLLFCWAGVPSVIGFIDGIVFLSRSDQEWNSKYGAIESDSRISFSLSII